MADDIQRTIYKLEIDDSSYTAGVDRLSNSTKKFTAEQQKANAILSENEQALKDNAATIEANKKALESYVGVDQKVRQQLSDNLQKSIVQQQILNKEIAISTQNYEDAMIAAKNFSNISASAAKIQADTTGGKIPTGTTIIPTAAPPILQTIAQADLSQLPKIIGSSDLEFEKFRIAVSNAEKEMQGLNSESDEFKKLAPIVEQGNQVMKNYDLVVRYAGDSTERLRTQILQGRDAITRLEEAGQQSSQVYIDLRDHVAKLNQEYIIANSELKVLASQTRVFDFGKASVQAAISGFQTYTSISILAGGASEELQKKTLQLFAAMQLLSSLDQLANSIKKGSIITTNLQSVAQATYTAVVGASTGALKAFRVALLATGIGAAVIGIGFLIAKYIQYKNTLDETAVKQKFLDDVSKEAVKGYAAEEVRLTLIKQKLDDLNIPQELRIKLAKEYNKTADEGNKIDTTQLDNINLINEAIGRQIEKIKQRAIAKAAENILTTKAESVIQDQLRLQKEIEKQGLTGDVFDQFFDVDVFLKNLKTRRGILNKGFVNTLFALGEDFKKDKKDFDISLQAVGGLIDIAGLFTDTKIEKPTNEVENVFLQKLKELQARLAELTAQSFESEGTIRKQFAASLAKELQTIADLAKPDKNGKSKLTPNQAGILNSLIGEINQVQLDKSLKDFRDKLLAAKEKIDDALETAENEAALKRIENIGNEFERQKLLIEQKTDDTQRALIKKRDDLLKEISDSKLSAADKKKKSLVVFGVFSELADQVEAARINEQLQNSFKAFEATTEEANAKFEETLVSINQDEAAQILAKKKFYDSGKITYKQYEDAITLIAKFSKNERDIVRRAELKAELDTKEAFLKSATDPEIIKALQKEVRDLKNAIAEIDKNTTGDKENKKKVDTVADYASAVGELTNSIIDFWQAQNDAETKALDRSITLQEKRVEQARIIAARGNAQYLKQEEDRLNQLNVQRENAARRQLGIDAALQASQVLVGITGAISKISTPGIGTAEVIADIALIIASLATGYGLVKSLQGNQPKLKKGDPYVTLNGHKAGTDTIPAWLNEGEAVIPTEKNKAYHPTVRAIYDGTIPAEHLNNFVNTYHKVKDIPQVNYDRIHAAAEMRIGNDGKLAGLLEENNNLQRQTLRAMKSMSVSANIDRNGVAIMVNEYISQVEKDKRI